MFSMCVLRWSALGLLSAVGIGASLFYSTYNGAPEHCHLTTPPATLPASGVAVVELFTSEGCSSCPPADQVLSRIVSAARKSGKKIYPLAFHVDYWNRLGWTDRFSSAAFSKRQSDYGDALGNNQSYTPQMIVNGSTEFVGSDEDRAGREIAKAISQPAAVGVNLEVQLDHHKVHAAYTTTGAEGMTINFAVVERGLRTDVKRGENSGNRLQHDNVVRAFKQADAAATGQVELDVPEDLQPPNSSAIAFISDSKTQAIRGATCADLPALTQK
jgi:hypothetical protein